MSREVGAFEAKNHLGALLSEAEKGQRIYITRRGKRVAMLIRADDGAETEDRRDLLKQIRTFRKKAQSGPESVKELVEVGRKR